MEREILMSGIKTGKDSSNQPFLKNLADSGLLLYAFSHQQVRYHQERINGYFYVPKYKSLKNNGFDSW